jgi:hypothetical protein
VIVPANIGTESFVSVMVEAPAERLPANAVRQLELRLAGTTLEAVLRRGDGFMTLATVTYDPGAHRFWKLAEQDGEVMWSTSRDGVAYAELARFAVPDMVTVRPRIHAFKGGNAPAGYQLAIDNVNAGIALDPICLADTLHESFDSELDPYVWPFVSNAIVRDGSVVLHAAEPTGAFASIHTGSVYSLDGSGITVEIPRIDLADPTAVVTVVAAAIGDGDDLVAFRISDELAARTADHELATVAYNPAAHRFLRLRVDRGTVVWEVSANGIDFQRFAQTIGGDGLATASLLFDAGAASSIEVELAGINAP